MLKTTTAAAALACTLLLTPALSQAASTNVFTGVDFKENSYYGYLVGVTALENQDILTQDGWLARGALGYGQYDYDTSAVVGGNVDGDVFNTDLMAGYNHHFTGGNVTGYLGAAFENQDISPNDPGNSVDGSRLGAKAQVELNLMPVEKVSLGSTVSYSTAYQTYWTHFDAGYDVGPFSIGPEVGFFGNEEYDQQRYGLAISGIDLGVVKTKIYGGWANVDDSGVGTGDGDSIYGGVGFTTNF